MGLLEVPYTLTLDGAGRIVIAGAVSGTGGLVKSGSGVATLSGANAFSGRSSVNAGILQLGTNTAFGSSAIVTNNGTLDLNGQDLTASMFNRPVIIGGIGTGVTVITNGASARGQIQDVVLGSDATIASANTIYIGGTNAQNGVLNLNGYTLTKAGSGTLLLNGVNLIGGGNITVNQGTLQLMDFYGNNQQNTALAGTGNLTINPGGSVMTYKWGPTLTVTMPMVLNGGTLGSGWPGPDGATFACPILVNSNSTINFDGGYGNGTFSGNIIGNGGLTLTGDGGTRTFTGDNSYSWTTIGAGVLQIGNGGTTGTLGLGNVTNNATLIFNRMDILQVTNQILGTGALIQSGTGTISLFGSNTYTGTTTVRAGTLMVNGSISSGATTIATNANLGGTGTITGPVTIQAGGILAPGTVAIGTLTISNNLTLSGGLSVKLNKGQTQSNDLVVVTGFLTNAGTGTITVTNLGPVLAVGDSFKLFSQPLLNGGALLIISVPGTGITWTNRLAVNGTITVTAAPVPATNLVIISVSPASFRVSGLGGTNQVYSLYASTNLTAPMSNWWQILSTNADSGGVIQILDTQATNAQRFYRFGQ